MVKENLPLYLLVYSTKFGEYFSRKPYKLSLIRAYALVYSMFKDKRFSRTLASCFSKPYVFLSLQTWASERFSVNLIQVCISSMDILLSSIIKTTLHMLINRSKYTIFPIKSIIILHSSSTYPNTFILDTLNVRLIKRTFLHEFLTRKT